MKLSQIKDTWWFKLYLKLSPYYSAVGLARYHEGTLTFCDIFWTIVWKGSLHIIGTAFIWLLITVVIGFLIIAVYSGVVVIPLEVLSHFKFHHFVTAVSSVLPIFSGDLHNIMVVLGAAADVVAGLFAISFSIRGVSRCLSKSKVGKVNKKGFISTAWHDFKTKSCTIIELDV